MSLEMRRAQFSISTVVLLCLKHIFQLFICVGLIVSRDVVPEAWFPGRTFN